MKTAYDVAREKYQQKEEMLRKREALHKSILPGGAHNEEEAPLAPDIRAMCSEMASFLIQKNKAYGNSASEPIGIFAKRIDQLAQIDIRIDDKLNRLKKGSEYPGDDTIKDLAGYLILRMIVAKKGSSDV